MIVPSAYAVYERATGRILRSGVCLSDQLAIQATEPRLAVLAGVGYDGCDLDCMVQDGKMVARPALPLPASINLKRGVERALTGLPDPVTVTIDGKPQTIKGGVLTLVSTMPATYRLGIDQWPYMPWQAEVKVA